MSLANITTPVRVIPVGDTTIAVRPFSTNTIASLIVKQREGLEPVFDIIEGAGLKSMDDLANINIAEVGQLLLIRTPEFMADLIAHAVGEPDLADAAAKLPAPVQMKILRAAMELTFVDETEFHEFLGNVFAAVKVMARALPQQFQPMRPESFASPSGTTASEPQLHS